MSRNFEVVWDLIPLLHHLFRSNIEDVDHGDISLVEWNLDIQFVDKRHTLPETYINIPGLHYAFGSQLWALQVD